MDSPSTRFCGTAVEHAAASSTSAANTRQRLITAPLTTASVPAQSNSVHVQPPISSVETLAHAGPRHQVHDAVHAIHALLMPRRTSCH